MTRALLTFLALAVLVAAGLVLAGVFDPAAPPDDVQPIGDDDREPGSTLEGSTDRPPTNRPDVEILRLDRAARALVLGTRRNTWEAFFVDAWAEHPSAEVVAWFFDEPAERASVAAGGAAPLDTPPNAADLGTFDVVAVLGIDPGVLEERFWESLATRVRDGELGLFVQPTALGDDRGVHPLLEQAHLAPLLPVADAHPVAGPRVPGLYRDPMPFLVTEAGTKHPASRRSRWETWSRTIWKESSSGEHRMSTMFVYPVAETPSSAEVLLQVRATGDRPWPALVAWRPDDGAGRVLWFGAPELAAERTGRGAYFEGRAASEMGVVVANWLAWLAGVG